MIEETNTLAYYDTEWKKFCSISPGDNLEGIKLLMWYCIAHRYNDLLSTCHFADQQDKNLIYLT